MNFFRKLFARKPTPPAGPNTAPVPAGPPPVPAGPSTRMSPVVLTSRPAGPYCPTERAPAPPEPVAVDMSRPKDPPVVRPLILHRLVKDSIEKTMCGKDCHEAQAFTYPTTSGQILFKSEARADQTEERIVHCASCFADLQDGQGPDSGYLAKVYLDNPVLLPPEMPPVQDEKGRSLGLSAVRHTAFFEANGHGPVSEETGEDPGQAWLLPEGLDPETQAIKDAIGRLGEQSMARHGLDKPQPSMSPEQFVYWLQGVFEVQKPETLNADQVKIIQEHLALVLTHVSGGPAGYVRAPSYCGRVC